MAALEPGTTVAHYKIIDKLGQGGQATAYRAEDLRLNRTVVMKVLRPELAANEAARRRFDREALLCSALDNPNISAIYDTGEADGHCYIVMQYVEGTTLKELIGGRPLDTPAALSIAIQIADALAVAHASGIVHRDIKPSNVIVTSAGQAKVLDFGLAKLVTGQRPDLEADDSLTDVGVPYGSLGYGSPEQAMGQSADHRSDVFSLGVVLYQMITGHLPFPGGTPLERIRAVLHQDPVPMSRFNARAPTALQRIVERAVAKDPGDRHQTMAAFRDELKALERRLAGAAGAGAQSRAPQRAPRPWAALGAGLGRVFGRKKDEQVDAEGPTPMKAVRSTTPSRPASWGTETKRTIAVLPFRNLSGDPQSDFYEFSLADAVITELAQVRSIVVRPSSYMAAYAGLTPDPRQVGEDLAVQAVLAGSFFRAPDRLRVTAQLVATASGEILWSDKVDVPAQDLITVQDTLAERVVTGLRLTLTPEEQARIGQRPTRSAPAYEFYLRGRDLLLRYVLRTLDLEDLERALGMFHEALGLDPDFAAAHAALARCYVLHAQGFGGDEYYQLAERSLRRALDLDPTDIEARLQGVHVDLHQGNKERAKATISALRRDRPNDPTVLLTAAMLYRLDGLYDRAHAEYDHLLALNPGDAVLVSYNKARLAMNQGDNDRAVAELEAGRAAQPEHPLLKTFMAIARFQQGRIAEAQSLIEEVLRQSPHFDAAQPLLAWCLTARGQPEAARALITERVRETARADHEVAYWLGCFCVGQGLRDEAMEWLRRSVFLGNEDYVLFRDSLILAPLRDYPPFVEFVSDLRARWERRVAAAPPLSP
jgi:TolB-like protein/tetratricopeptide (TPR) repeat protein/tRNA A-37 threonylcarbamoyl transferase component Bud32